MNTLTAKQHRANARAYLGGNIFHKNWLTALLIAIVQSAILGVASMVTSGVGTLILAGPMAYGLIACYFSFARTGETKIETLFDGFKQDFVQTFLIGLMQSVFVFLWSLLFIIPGIVKSYSYSMAQYIKHDNPTWNWEQCITESRRIMDGNKWKLFCLQLSFIGWLFVSMLTCAIGNLWLIPYMGAANLSFYESIKNKA